MADALELTRRYLAAADTGDDLARFYAPEILKAESPTRLLPQGARRDLPALLEAAARGQQVLAAQRYEILHAVASGDQVAVEFRWVGTLAVPVGSLPAGG